jgi:hypothetical protein
MRKQYHQPSLPTRRHNCISGSLDHRYQADVSHEESTSTTIATASAAAATIAAEHNSVTYPTPVEC